MAAPETFEAATAITPLSSHTYSAHLQLSWCIGTVPHGGYVTSIFHTVATTHLARTHPSLHNGAASPITIHLTFLRRTEAGPATFSVVDTKLGSRTSTLHITLSQRDPDGAVRDEVAGYITVSNFAAEEGPSLTTSYELHPAPARGSLSAPRASSSSSAGTARQQTVDLAKLARDGEDGQWREFEMAFGAVRKAAGHVQFFTSQTAQAQPGLVEQWVRFRPYGKLGRWTDASLGYLVDMFPLMLQNFDKRPWEGGSGSGDGDGDGGAGAGKAGGKAPASWYPTVLLNVDFKKKLPAEGVEWLYSRVQMRVMKNGRMDLDLVLLDEMGEVVALSNHVALVVSAQRNYKSRTGKGKGNGSGNGGAQSKI
ncbi:hypothetical protein FQN53_008094 [Emmonsiellopsis sp. PD_33]|nr:hypothetical protein FQN53_008094 [Emmonsiellopsis sp. PD_33]